MFSHVTVSCDSNPAANTPNSVAPTGVSQQLGAVVQLSCASGYQQAGSGTLLTTCTNPSNNKSGVWSEVNAQCICKLNIILHYKLSHICQRSTVHIVILKIFVGRNWNRNTQTTMKLHYVVA